jgi:precorrin-2 dehydrogenase / sirohydrochlorin ferrochelatase
MKSKDETYFPVFLNIRRKKCVVVGGGEVAFRKVRMLLDSGANVTVISPVLHPDLFELADKKSIQVIRRSFKLGDLKGAFIVIAATDTKQINRKVAEEAGRVGALVNVVDNPEPSDFIVPSLLRRGDLTITISTGGMSPALAKKIRMRLEESFGEEYALLVSLVEEVRSTLRREGMKMNAERWQDALDLDLLTHLVRTGQKQKAKAALMKKLKSAKRKMQASLSNP